MKLLLLPYRYVVLYCEGTMVDRFILTVLVPSFEDPRGRILKTEDVPIFKLRKCASYGNFMIEREVVKTRDGRVLCPHCARLML